MVFNSETAIALIRFFVPIIVSALTMIGIKLDVDTVQTVITGVIAIILFIYMWWWKNNNITHAAQEAQKVLRGTKITEKSNKDNKNLDTDGDNL